MSIKANAARFTKNWAADFVKNHGSFLTDPAEQAQDTRLAKDTFKQAEKLATTIEERAMATIYGKAIEGHDDVTASKILFQGAYTIANFRQQSLASAATTAGSLVGAAVGTALESLMPYGTALNDSLSTGLNLVKEESHDPAEVAVAEAALHLTDERARRNWPKTLPTIALEAASTLASDVRGLPPEVAVAEMGLKIGDTIARYGSKMAPERQYLSDVVYQRVESLVDPEMELWDRARDQGFQPDPSMDGPRGNLAFLADYCRNTLGK